MALIATSNVIPGAMQFFNAGAPGAGTSEVQTVTLANVTGGTFTITFDGYTTAAITWSATTNTLLANVNTAVRALPNVGGTALTATDSTLSGGNGDFLLTASGVLGKLAINTMTANGAALTGAGAAVSIAETTPGVTATGRGLGPGAVCTDVTNSKIYVNTGTAIAPAWTVVGSQS